MPFTHGNDLNLLQSTDTPFVGAGAGNDRYILDAATLGPNQQITITDTQGINILHLVGGLQILSSKVASTALQLTLNNGAVITVLSAHTFQYQTGGNPLTGNGALVQNFADFASQGLKVTVPAPGAAFVDGGSVIVNQGGGASVPDTTAPAAPVINAVATNNIVNAAENTNLVISGTGEVGATVTLANTSQTAVVNAQGTWSITVADAAAAFGQGAETLSVTQQDAAGNTSQVATRAITVDTLLPADTTAPAAPVINAVATNNIVNADENTNLVISGTGEVGATVTLANTSQTAVVNAQGNWSITVADAAAAFGQGAETLSVTQQDAAGNTSQVATRAITVDTLLPADTTAPAAPVINAVATNNIVNADENTNLVISGTGEVGATVTLVNTSQTAVVNAQGTWSITVADAAAAFGQGAETLSVTQQDAAGNTSQVAARAITVDTLPPVDTTPPAFLSAVTSADGTKLILSYGEALASATAAKEAFAVTVNGQPNAVTAVAVSGSTVELTLASAVISGQAITVAYTDPTAGNDASAVQDAAGNDTPTLAAQAVTNNAPIEGVVIDGYVAGATVYADIDGDGIQDPNEPFTTTDANGNYSLAANGNYRIVAYGGNDLMTGKAFEGVLTAPAGSTTVSPITTLVQAAIESGKTIEAATTEVRTALGLPASVTNIVTYDPIAALAANAADPTALAVQKAAQQVASVITQTTTAIDAADPTKSKKEVAREVIKALSETISNTLAGQTTAAPVDLTQASTLTTIVTSAAKATGTSSIVTNAASVAQVTASSNAQIQNATTLVNLNKAAVVSQVNAVQAMQTAATNNTLGDAATEFTNTVEQLVQEADTGKLTTEQPVETPPANAAPVGVIDTLAATEDTAATYTAADLLGNDTDANGDALSIKSITAGSGGAVVLNDNGSVTFTPAANFNGAASFSYVATDGKGGDSAATTVTVNVAAVNDAPTGAVTITGTATEGQTLTAANTLADADADGPASLSVSYQWKAGGVDIANATASTYVLQAADVGKPITVVARYTDSQGSAESVTSAATAAVVAAPFVDTEATGTLTITGTAAEGATISADISGITDTDGAITSAYQWQENIGGTWTKLSGKTAAALAIPDDQSYVGKSIRVVATTTDAKGGTTEFTSAAQTVANVNDTPTGTVTITGTATEGQTLTANTSALADADGLGTLSYQWLREGSAITGATASTYVLQAADVGKPITVVARYTDGQGTAESVTSAATAAVVAAPFVDTEATGTLTITGTAAEGATISADISGITDTDGAITSAYQWQENIGGTWTNLSGKTAAALAIPDDQSYVGKSIRVVATTTDAKGGTTEFTSAAQTVANVNDLPTGTVTITGTATEGQTLTANTSALADADGLGTLSYQWLREGVAITGATGSTYVLQAADVGKPITVVARYTDGQGTAESVTSAATQAVTAPDDNGTRDAPALDESLGNDVINGNQRTVMSDPKAFNAGNGNDQYVLNTDVALYAANIQITGFGQGDQLVFEVFNGTTLADLNEVYAVTDDLTDVTLVANVGGSVQQITLVDQIGNRMGVGGSVDSMTELASFLGANAIDLTGKPAPGNGSLQAPANTESNGSDVINGNQSTVLSSPRNFNAANGDDQYVLNTDVAAYAANIRINGFGASDRLVFDAAPGTTLSSLDAIYAITDDLTDVTLVANVSGSVQQITLVGLTGSRAAVEGSIDTLTELSSFLGANAIALI